MWVERFNEIEEGRIELNFSEGKIFGEYNILSLKPWAYITSKGVLGGLYKRGAYVRVGL